MLSAIVPVHVWNDLFLHGHGFLTAIENVIIGPFIAVIAFCARWAMSRWRPRCGAVESGSAA